MMQSKIHTLLQDNLPSVAFRSSIITSEQLRAARGFMDWSRGELGEAASISPETVKNIEFGIFSPQPGTQAAILQAFADNGIQFLNLSIFAPYTITGVFRVVTANAGEKS